jgi:two-component system probable response regulator PhcQ
MKPGDQAGRYAVLFVDDEEKALKYFRMAFSRDFPVLTAGSVADALEMLEQRGEEIAVLITDQRMPGQQGVDLLKRARTDWPGIVRILTTAYSDLDDAIEAVNRGEILRYITKPWDIEDLRRELKHAMEFFLLRRERDLLMAEKISVRQGMVQGDRLRGLLAIAAGLRRLRNAPHAVAAWAHDAIEATPRVPVSPDELELWGLEVKETLGLMSVHRSLRSFDASVEPGFPDRLRIDELAREAGLDVDGEAMAVRGRRELLADLLGCLGRLAGRPAEVQIADAAVRDTTRGLALVLTGPGPASGGFPGDRPEEAGRGGMLEAYLIAWHHGGSLHVRNDETGLRFELVLPEDPEAVDLPMPDADWLAVQFAMLENW